MLLRDVTEFQQLQDERNKVQMMKMLHTTVSHDVMSPMHNIQQFADKMLETARVLNFEETAKYHNLICESAKLVTSFAKDLLDQELIDHGSFVPNEVNFIPNKAVKQIARILENTLKNFKWNVKVEESFDGNLNQPFNGDSDRI